MSALTDRIAEVLQAELDEHGCEDDDEKRWRVAQHWAERITEASNERRTGYVGWVEFLKDQVSTTHIAYLHEDGSVYFPEGPQVVSEIDLRFAEAAGRMWPLVRSGWSAAEEHS